MPEWISRTYPLYFRRCHVMTVMTLSVLLSLSEATWNLFMNKTETKRHLGIHEDVYYVRNGTVNEYALTFNLPLKGHVRDIYFDWNSVEKHESLYRMVLSTSNPSAIEIPLLSIANNGRIPTKPSTFGVRLPCSGFVSSEVDIRIHLNITSPVTLNTTIIELRRRKTCLMGDTQLLVADDEGGEGLILFASTVKPRDDLSSDAVLLLVLGTAIGLFVVVAVVVVVLCNVRQQQRSRDPVVGYQLSQGRYAKATAKDKNGNKSASASCTRSLLSAGSPIRPSSPIRNLDQCMAPIGIAMEAIKASQVSLKRLIMEGSVGRLYYGSLTNDSGDIQYPILAKTINGEMSDAEFQLFLSDVYSLKGCCHGNIQPMLCCVLEPLHRPLVVYRFSNDCNLKIYLRTCRASQLLSSVQMLQMIMGICDGLCFLHGRMIVHKDVASRNCLVDDCLTVRLTDAALSSDFFPEDYYLSPADGNPVPVRWLPTETLENCVYDMTSEVWSFGVTAWEVLTYGQQPYSEFGSNEILRELRSGYRLPLPSCCSEEIYQLLADCWQALPDARPSLPLVYRSIEEICATLGHFV